MFNQEDFRWLCPGSVSTPLSTKHFHHKRNPPLKAFFFKICNFRICLFKPEMTSTSSKRAIFIQTSSLPPWFFLPRSFFATKVAFKDHPMQNRRVATKLKGRRRDMSQTLRRNIFEWNASNDFYGNLLPSRFWNFYSDSTCLHFFVYYMDSVSSAGLFWTKLIALPCSPTMFFLLHDLSAICWKTLWN